MLQYLLESRKEELRRKFVPLLHQNPSETPNLREIDYIILNELDSLDSTMIRLTNMFAEQRNRNEVIQSCMASIDERLQNVSRAFKASVSPHPHELGPRVLPATGGYVDNSGQININDELPCVHVQPPHPSSITCLMCGKIAGNH